MGQVLHPLSQSLVQSYQWFAHMFTEVIFLCVAVNLRVNHIKAICDGRAKSVDD